MKQLIAHVDGASRGNPGPAGIGVVIETPENEVLAEIGEPLGRTTNNVAEYTAMIRCLEEAKALGGTHIQVMTDSELMARQINGIYRVRTPHILPLYERVMTLMRSFEKASVKHVRREFNKHADRLSNVGADQVK